MRTNLIVLADRAPVRGAMRAGLETAIDEVLRERDGIWLARRGDAAELPASPGDRFCDRALWPLFHGLLDHVRYATADWERYVETNSTYAERVLELITPGGAVWAHGYRWLLVPAALRRYGHRGPVGLFLDVPFPAPELLDTLPWCAAILQSLGELDVIGFHAAAWGDHLAACLARAGARVPRIAVLPPGIEPQPPVLAAPDADLALGGRRLILGIDHLDPAGGIVERLLAFEQLLERHAGWRGRVILAQIAVASRLDPGEHDDLRRRVEKLVGRINGRFGEADWVPIRYLSRPAEPGLLAQLYRAADVALVTPLRDGGSYVPLEVVAAQDPARPGVLVLSRFAAAATALDGALLTNPYHHDGVAEDLDRALRMPLDERRDRHRRLAAAATRSTPRRWVTTFLDELATAAAVPAVPA